MRLPGFSQSEDNVSGDQKLPNWREWELAREGFRTHMCKVELPTIFLPKPVIRSQRISLSTGNPWRFGHRGEHASCLFYTTHPRRQRQIGLIKGGREGTLLTLSQQERAYSQPT